MHLIAHRSVIAANEYYYIPPLIPFPTKCYLHYAFTVFLRDLHEPLIAQQIAVFVSEGILCLHLYIVLVEVFTELFLVTERIAFHLVYYRHNLHFRNEPVNSFV